MSDKQSTDTPEAQDDDALLQRARKAFERCKEAAGENHTTYKDDVDFARLGHQWPSNIVEQRDRDNRPMLTINRLPTFIRQVVNDARQNKPSIKVHPADSGADKETAEVINGLIRNIEYTSNADVAYDTAVECAAQGGFGYWRINLDYAFDDSFDLDICIERISNPLSVYGDPNSTAADSSDWNVAFVTEVLSDDEFKAQYPNARQKVSWEEEDAWNEAEDWRDNGVVVAEWWEREEVEETIYRTTDGMVISEKQIAEDSDIQLGIEAGLIQFATDQNGERISRVVKSYKVTQRIMSGLEILEENEWPGCYIPIVPVYGDEIILNGKRYFRSLIHDAIDAQRMFNYWRTTSTELVALAPRVPFIGPEGAFDSDIEKWSTVNSQSHAFIEYDKSAIAPPQRQPLDSGPAAGALQEAMNAADDMKSTIGLYDASLGAKSNETSGKAILARQREGDTSTFHFIDNLSRAIRHTGRIIIDLIPPVYDTPRIIRVLGEDGQEQAKPVNQQYPKQDKQGQPVMDERGQAIMALHDLTAGKYDLTVTTGPSFTTRREEAAYQMTEMMRALPASAPILGKHLAKNLDWPGADDIAEELEALAPKPDAIPPQVKQMIQEGQKVIQELQAKVKELEGDRTLEMAKVQNDYNKTEIDAFKAETDRMQAEEQNPGPLPNVEQPAGR